MQDLSIVTVLESETNLREPVKNLVFCVVFPRGGWLPLVFRLHFLDLASHVSSISMVHHNAKLPLLCLIHFFKSDDVRVI